MIQFAYSKAYRQGELLFFKVRERSLTTYSRLTKVPSGVIRVGEKEGHEHKATGEAQLCMMLNTTPKPGTGKVEPPSEGVLEVGGKGATITHPEHKDLKLPKGKYVVKTQKEATGTHTTQSVRD